jgi:hypothetical protein
MEEPHITNISHPKSANLRSEIRDLKLFLGFPCSWKKASIVVPRFRINQRLKPGALSLAVQPMRGKRPERHCKKGGYRAEGEK